MSKSRKTLTAPTFAETLNCEHLVGLCTELQTLRDHPPLVSKGNGKYEGDILGFVRGLRLSARVIYFLRESLEGSEWKVCWGHLLSEDGAMCSPECDIIIHKGGVRRKWNGYQPSIMEFYFIDASCAKIVISCKSKTDRIDKYYPKQLRKYGVHNIFLFAECCEKGQVTGLKKSAKSAGYVDVFFLYHQDKRNPGSYERDEKSYTAFIESVKNALSES